MISQRDREILRSLAGKVREIADNPEMEKRRQRWYGFNALKAERPMVLCFPEGAWEELLPQKELECEDRKLRSWEWNLRSKIYWWEHIRDDAAIDPWFHINWHVSIGDYGVEIPYRHGENRGSYVWDPPIKDLKKDMKKLHFRELSVDRRGTLDDVERAEEIFGDLLPVRIRGGFWWTMGLTAEIIKLIGLQNLMLYMYDDPENLHNLMAWMRDEHLHFIKWFEREGLLSLNNEGDYVGSGGLGYTHELPTGPKGPGEPVLLKDCWGLGESQETVGISPKMFEDFILPYQLPLLSQFGLLCYGCCEPIDGRIDALLKLPNLRRVSVSPWSNQEIMAEKLGKNYIFSRKPNPSMICTTFNEEEIRKDVANTLSIAGDGVLEIIMKDTHTVQNQPWRITRWVEIALEEVHRYMDKKG